MKTHSRRIVTAALLAAVALGSTAALAEGGGSPVPGQQAKLKAEWAEARARNATNPDASFIERLFGLGGEEQTVAATAKPATATAKSTVRPKQN